MENEIMNYEDEVMDIEVEPIETEGSGVSTGVAIAIGAGLAVAATAIVKLVKKAVAKHKAKKELHLVEEGEIIEPTEEEIVEVAK